MDLRKAFKAFDRDGSGSLSVQELKSVLTRPGGGQPLSDDEVRAIMNEFDASGDGELQYEEFAAMWGFNTGTPRGPHQSGGGFFTRFVFRVPGARGSPVQARKKRDKQHSQDPTANEGGTSAGKKATPSASAEEETSSHSGRAAAKAGGSLHGAGGSFRKTIGSFKKSAAKASSFKKSVATSFRRPKKGAKPSATAVGTSSGGSGTVLASALRLSDDGGDDGQSIAPPATASSAPAPDAAAANAKGATSGATPRQFSAAQIARGKSLSRVAGTDVASDAEEAKRRAARPLYKSSKLAKIRADYLKKGADEEAKRSSFASLPARLGKLLHTRTVSDVVREWDANGDGEVSLFEFRRSLRDPKLGLEGEFETHDIDELFRSIDTDKGGSLDANELRTALRRLRKQAESAGADEARCERMAEHWRLRAKQAQEAQQVTEEYEKAERTLRDVRVLLGKADKTSSSSSTTSLKPGGQAGGEKAGAGDGGNDTTTRGALDARLYAAMMQRNIRIGEVTSKWDSDHDGFISRGEFKAGVMKIVLDADEGEVDDLFDSLDIDDGGELDVQELKQAFKTLSDAAAKASHEEARLVDEKARLRRKAAGLQELVRQRQEEDASAFAAEEAKERERADIEAKEAEEAKEAKAAARAERRAKAAQEKQRFEEAVAAKRAKAHQKERKGHAGNADEARQSVEA